MKRIVAISMVLCLLFSMSAKLGLLLNYYANMRQITEEHCVNKNRPEMHCNGSCYLSSQMKETEPREPVFPNLELLKDLSPAVFFSRPALHVQFPKTADTHFPASASQQVLQRVPGSIFQPPEL